MTPEGQKLTEAYELVRMKIRNRAVLNTVAAYQEMDEQDIAGSAAKFRYDTVADVLFSEVDQAGLAQSYVTFLEMTETGKLPKEDQVIDWELLLTDLHYTD